MAPLPRAPSGPPSFASSKRPSVPPENPRRKKGKHPSAPAADEDGAPEGVAAFIQTPEPLACFIHDLLRGPPPAEVKTLYLMPCVGTGAIPLAWIRAGKHLSGAVFCELLPENLAALEAKFVEAGWRLTVEANLDEWERHVAEGKEVSSHLAARGAAEKALDSLKRTGQSDSPAKDALVRAIKDNKEDPANRRREAVIEEPIYRGHLSKDGAVIFLFQGSAVRLFGEPGQDRACARLREILAQHAPPAWRIVAVENLPWGNSTFLGKTAKSSNVELIPAVVARTTPGCRSAFILDRHGLVADTPQLVPKQIFALWAHGSIVRMFPLPTETFPGHQMAMACLFLFRRFEPRELDRYAELSAKLARNREGAAPLRYYCGLLAAEDMAWARLTKSVSHKDGPRTNLLFADSAMDHQNRVLSDRPSVVFASGLAKNPKGRRLIQTPGLLATDLANRLEEETATQLGEVALETMYHAYRRAVLGLTGPDKYITAHALVGASEKVVRCQSRLLKALRAMTSRDAHGNIAYAVVPERARNDVAPDQHGLDPFVAHKEVSRLIRLAALIHRVVVPSFVLDRLEFLYCTYRGKPGLTGLRQELANVYEPFVTEEGRTFLERTALGEEDGQFLDELEPPGRLNPEALAKLDGRILDPHVGRIRVLLERLFENLPTSDPVSPPGPPAWDRLDEAPYNQSVIPGGRQACSPMAVLAISSLLQTGRIDVPHVLLEGAALYGQMMARADEQAELIRALEMSLQRQPPVEGPGAAMEPRELPEIGHWNPHSVADWVSTLQRRETGSFPPDQAKKWLDAFFAAKGDRGAALVVGGYTIAIARYGPLFHLFDSHGCRGITQNAFCAAFSAPEKLCGFVLAMIEGRIGSRPRVGYTIFDRADR